MGDTFDEEKDEVFKRLFEYLWGRGPLEAAKSHPDRTNECLPLDRVFVAIGLEKAEQKHLAGCDFCRRRVTAFGNLPLPLRRPIPLHEVAGAVLVPPAAIPAGSVPVPFFRRWLKIFAMAACILLCLGLVAERSVALGKALRELAAALSEASQLRQRLDAMHKAVGLDRSFLVDFAAEQPNSVLVDVRIDPLLVRLAEVSYDAGGSWKRLYEAGQQAAAEPVVRLEDEHAFTPPAAGKAEVTARVRVQYIPAVMEAFPEYGSSDKTERSAEYEVSTAEIKKVGEGPTTQPPASVTAVDLAASRWELNNSANATIVAESDSKDKVLVAKMALKDVGEWATLSHSIPGATPSNPTVSLKDVTHIEVRMVWNNPAQVTMETKLVDDFGKITGTVKFLAPGKALQTVRIPLASMKPYFGVPRVDLSRIRRVELTFARKMPNQAAEGAVRIEGVSVVGTKPLPAAWKPPSAYAALESLSLRPDSWKTAKSARGQIAVAAEGDSLACKVNLPYHTGPDKELSWTSLWTQPPNKSFPGLQAVELELRWDGEAPITIEPQLSMGSQGDTYGMQVRVRPARDLQKILIHPQDLKYFWTFAGETSAKGMDLGNIVSFHLGIARKAVDQAERGTLSIRSVRFLGSDQKPQSSTETPDQRNTHFCRRAAKPVRILVGQATVTKAEINTK